MPPRWIPLILVSFLSACAHSATKIEYAPGMDLSRYHIIGILPFTDQQGRGREIAEAIVSGLPSRGFEVADMAKLEKVFKRFKPDQAMGLGMTELTEIKQGSRAQAILLGEVDASGGKADIILLETELGDLVFRARLRPTHEGPFANAQEVADPVLHLFADLPSREKDK